MYIVLLCVVLQSFIVKSENVCDKCICRYDSKTKRDYEGQIVDCSMQNQMLEANYNLPSLVLSLDLSTNNITRLTTNDLFKSNTLTELRLNKNFIVEIKEAVFELPELKRLDLSDNDIEFLDKEVFVNMWKLEYLNIANNKITTFEKLTFHRLSGLKEAVLDNNNLGPHLKNTNLFDRNGFGLTNKIESLSIKGINLNQVPDNFFVDAYAIKKLIISNNNIIRIFEIPYTLEYLDLSDNPLKDLQGEDFAELPALRILKLNNISISAVPDFLFSSLKGLKSLELDRNKNMTVFSSLAFGQEVLDDADDFTLESFSMKNCRLSSLSDSLLEPFGQLIKLDLQGNPWNCDCNLKWIRQLQIHKSMSDNIRCGRPSPFYNQRVFDLKDDQLICKIHRHFTGLTIAVVTFLLSLSFIAVWLVFILPKYSSRGKYISGMANLETAYTILPMHASGLHT